MAGLIDTKRVSAATSSGETRPRVLILTLAARTGGVPEMLGFVVDALRAAGMEPVLAYYQPYSLTPELSVPFYRLFSLRGPGSRREQRQGGVEAHAMGAWLPELEFTHYWPTRHWRTLLDSCDCHVCVSGNALAATPFALTQRPFVAWVATPWHEDRTDRVMRFPWPRRWLDRLVNSPVLRRLENRTLRSGTILALSRYTQEALNRIAGRPVVEGILPQPIDTEMFSPDPTAVRPGHVGFVGRFDDPRKNTGLLLKAAALCQRQGAAVEVRLVGAEPSPELSALADVPELKGKVTFLPGLPHDRLPAHLKAFDVFVIPSHQEGLCIAALEAMACGCPVISTRCGGPEEYIKDGATGYLVEAQPDAMAEVMRKVVENRELRSHLGKNARQRVLQDYSRKRAEQVFLRAFDQTFLRSSDRHNLEATDVPGLPPA